MQTTFWLEQIHAFISKPFKWPQKSFIFICHNILLKNYPNINENKKWTFFVKKFADIHHTCTSYSPNKVSLSHWQLVNVPQYDYLQIQLSILYDLRNIIIPASKISNIPFSCILDICPNPKCRMLANIFDPVMGSELQNFLFHHLVWRISQNFVYKTSAPS